MEEAGSGHEDSSHNILTLDACRFCRPVTPGLSMSMRIRPICKVYMHTYMHARK
jgi:3-hydroxymyristoyl/3-hydroxydecanoyl-(acyl carrier protein) dehydratase